MLGVRYTSTDIHRSWRAAKEIKVMDKKYNTMFMKFDKAAESVNSLPAL